MSEACFYVTVTGVSATNIICNELVTETQTGLGPLDACPLCPRRHLPLRLAADPGAAAHLGLVLEGRLPLHRPSPLRTPPHLQVGKMAEARLRELIHVASHTGLRNIGLDLFSYLSVQYVHACSQGP